jgi:hypothetical protein
MRNQQKEWKAAKINSIIYWEFEATGTRDGA